MKKIAPIIAALLCIFLLASCDKTWTCTCTVYQPGYEPHVVSTSIDKMSQGDAQYKCDQVKADFTARALSSDCHI